MYVCMCVCICKNMRLKSSQSNLIHLFIHILIHVNKNFRYNIEHCLYCCCTFLYNVCLLALIFLCCTRMVTIIKKNFFFEILLLYVACCYCNCCVCWLWCCCCCWCYYCCCHFILWLKARALNAKMQMWFKKQLLTLYCSRLTLWLSGLAGQLCFSDSILQLAYIVSHCLVSLRVLHWFVSVFWRG